MKLTIPNEWPGASGLGSRREQAPGLTSQEGPGGTFGAGYS
jgi:hypothetical protein